MTISRPMPVISSAEHQRQRRRAPCPPRSAAKTSSSHRRRLQYISYYHPADFIAHLARAYEREPGGQGRDRADPDQLADVRRGPPPDLPGHRHRQRVPEVGMDVRWEGFAGQLEDAGQSKACAAAT
jgi:hypothetical protein